jgi:acyl carrier protein
MAEPFDAGTLATVVAALVDVTGLDPDALTPAARLEEDLQLESLDLLAWGDLLRVRYGDHVDLVGHVAELELDQIIALRIADVAAYVAARGGEK